MSSGGSKKQSWRHRNPIRILVVDDERHFELIVRKAFRKQIESREYAFQFAFNGLEALTKLEEMPEIDVVLTDINMPEMDGISLCKELRNLDQYKYTPILMLTTESAGDKKTEGKSAGATGWIVKPFNPDQLLATIKKVIH